MEIRSGSLSFPRLRGHGPQTENMIFNFDAPVTQAVAVLTGMRFGFSEDDGVEDTG